MYCFPGGAIEQGEIESAAIVRELFEELALMATAVRQLWSSVAPWGVSLSWWLASVEHQAMPRPNPEEVASYHWLTVAKIRQLPKLLASNHEFLSAWESGAFTIDGLYSSRSA